MRKLKINIESLSKNFGEKKVLNKLNLKIYESESLAIIGESGSGKSVLTKCIDGLMNYDDGKISFNEIPDICKLSFQNKNKYMAKFGILFQNAALLDSLTVKENLTFASKNNDFLEILNDIALPKSILKEFPSNLSIGVQKRVGLARAVLQNPEILILDEPTTGLDPIVAKQ
jgi:ABC-type transport system involved in resistance to organic solvents, ATPase component